MGGTGGRRGNGADVILLLREGSQAPEDIDLQAAGGYGGSETHSRRITKSHFVNRIS